MVDGTALEMRQVLSLRGSNPLPSAIQANVIGLIIELERLLRPQNLFRKN